MTPAPPEREEGRKPSDAKKGMADEGDSNLLPQRESLSLEAVFGFEFGRQPVNLVELANGDEPDRLAKNAALGFLAKRAETLLYPRRSGGLPWGLAGDSAPG
jgi:hypothetical protein